MQPNQRQRESPSGSKPKDRFGDVLAYRIEETRGWAAVYHAMIECQAKCDHLAGGNLAVVDRRFAYDASDPQNGGLGQVDNRCKSVDAIHAKIGNRKSTPLHRLTPEALLTRAFNQPLRLRGYLTQRLSR